ncbi:MAG: OsmC family protein [Deltaproteobacteria bacterium]|nr:OsmC family protein [Deltaproteobacteria bacterium]
MNISLGPNQLVTARWDNFEVSTDQPVSQGGQGNAPSPFELFLASLATCTAFYVLGFCRTRDIPTDDVKLVQRLITSEDGKEEKAIEMEIILPPEFPAKYEKAVVKAASMCHVKKTILNPPEITLNARRA